jgi:hypothetical protein
MKKKLTTKQVHQLVLGRLTKGDAFLLDDAAYTERQQSVADTLASMTIAEMKRRWPHLTYDVK